jgi:uncharacterized protein (TIGR03435 family)
MPKLSLDKDGYPELPAGYVGMMLTNGRGRLSQPQWSMEQLCMFLRAQRRAPVADRTGLTGKYEVRLFWFIDGQRRSTPENAEADVPLGPNLSQALEEQLGLKMSETKGPVEIVVVDRANKTPVEN